jgi:putative membrane protein
MELADLPGLNAILNSTATVLLISGLVSIKTGRKRAHVICMVSALVVSAAFLTSYLIYHYNHPTTKFTHDGWPKTIYFFILATHIPLAALNLPMIILTVVPAVRQRFDRHKKIARWTYPIWLYVSVTGVLVYLMLYRWYPPA